MPKKNLALAGASLLLAAQSALAQNPAASQTVESQQQRRQFEPADNGQTDAPELYPGETSDIGPQSVLKIKSPRWHLEAVADEEIFYTDNMFLSEQQEQAVDVVVSTIQAAIVAPEQKIFGGVLTPRVGYQSQWYTYNLFDNAHVSTVNLNNVFQSTLTSLSAYNFNAQTIFGDAVWTRGNTAIGLGFNFQRLLDSDTYQEFYREYTPNWSIQQTIQLTSRISLTAGYQGDYRFTLTQNVPAGTSGEVNDRLDSIAFGVLNFKLCSHAIIQPYYQFEQSHYTAQDRDDLLNTCGIALYLPLTKNVSLRAFYSYARFNTDGFLVPDYQNMQGGFGATLSVEF